MHPTIQHHVWTACVLDADASTHVELSQRLEGAGVSIAPSAPAPAKGAAFGELATHVQQCDGANLFVVDADDWAAVTMEQWVDLLSGLGPSTVSGMLFVTDSRESEAARALAARDAIGDCIRKPLDPDLLTLRLHHLTRLAKQAQRDLPHAMLHAASGRVDAKRLAAFFRVQLKELCFMIGEGDQASYKRIHRTSDSRSVQPSVAPLRRIAGLVIDLYGPEMGPTWLKAPHVNLDGLTPMEVLRGRSNSEAGAHLQTISREERFELVEGLLMREAFGMPK